MSGSKENNQENLGNQGKRLLLNKELTFEERQAMERANTRTDEIFLEELLELGLPVDSSRLDNERE